MRQKVYLKQDEQIELIKQLGLKCAFEIGLKTSFITVGERNTDYDIFVVILLLRNTGTVLQKWQCSKNEDGSYYSKVLYENTDAFITCVIDNCDDNNTW